MVVPGRYVARDKRSSAFVDFSTSPGSGDLGFRLDITIDSGVWAVDGRNGLLGEEKRSREEEDKEMRTFLLQ